MRRASLALAVGAVLALGCGYRFTAAGSPLPNGIREVRVPVFQNHTGEPGLELVYTQALREQAGRAGTAGASRLGSYRRLAAALRRNDPWEA